MSIQYGDSETRRSGMQKDANNAVYVLRKMHRECEVYDVVLNEEGIKVENCVVGGESKDRLVAENYSYYMELNGEDIAITEGRKTINTLTSDTKYTIDLTVKGKVHDREVSIKVDTIISKYK